MKDPNRKAETDSLAAEISKLSRMLTRERSRLPSGYLRDPGLRKAYLEYFLPANELKIHLPLSELLLHPSGLFGKEELRVLDIGTGPGTSIIGALGFFANRDRRPRLFFTAVDHVRENLDEAGRLFRERSGPADSLRTLNASVEELPGRMTEQFDLIIFSNVLNELFPGKEDRIPLRIRMTENILRSLLTADGSCVIIEPALRETSRDLLLLRDGLLEKGHFVFSPCLVQGPCPALANPRDWCHEDLPWEPPARIREIDRRTGLRKDSLKFSYLVLRKDALSLAGILTERSFRVVSEPLLSRGKTEFFLCGPGGRRLATRLEKDKTPDNEPFGALRRGMIVSFQGLIDEEKRFRVVKKTLVRPGMLEKNKSGYNDSDRVGEHSPE